MFYSPKKDIERYVAIKNHEIQTLKEEIDSEKITEESVEAAKKRLDKLKDQYNELASENYLQFEHNIRKNQERKVLLKQEINYKQRQINLKRNQECDVVQMKKEIADKIKKTKEKIQTNKSKQIQIKKQRDQLNSKISNLTRLAQKLRIQTTDLNDLQTSAKKELNDCKGRVQLQREKCKLIEQEMNQTGLRILAQKQKINRISQDNEIQQTKIQNLQLKIQNALYIKSNLLEHKQKIELQKLMVKQRSQLNRHQCISDETMKIIVKISEAMKQSKERQKENCEREIKQKLIQLELSQCVNSEILYSVSEMKEKIDRKEKRITKISGQMENVIVKDLELVTMMIGQQKTKNQQKAKHQQKTPFKMINTNKESKQTPHKPSAHKFQQPKLKHNSPVEEIQSENLPVIQF